MTYQNSATGAVQEVAEREQAKRRILESAGWRPVKLDVPPVPPEQPRKKRAKKAAAE